MLFGVFDECVDVVGVCEVGEFWREIEDVEGCVVCFGGMLLCE